jgi:hypothetical protein
MRAKHRAGRSYVSISGADLAKLANIARADREDFLSRRREDFLSRRREYRARVLLVALCQGAALHYLDGRNRIKDFDVWTFYAREPGKHPYHPLRHPQADFGRSKFGGDTGFAGRQVDLLGRTIKEVGNPIESVRGWLRAGKPKSSAWYLAKKAVIVLEPAKLRGEVVWPE